MIAQCYSILLPFKHIIDYLFRLVLLKVYDVLLTLASKIPFISKYSEPYYIVTFTHKCKKYYSSLENKGNNKITKLRTILQRESQKKNSNFNRIVF